MIFTQNVVTIGIAAISVLAGVVNAHPGEHHGHSAVELARSSRIMSLGKRSLDSCSNSVEARKVQERAIQRRAEKVDQLRTGGSKSKPCQTKGGHKVKERDLATVLATDHHSNRTGITPNIDDTILFGNKVSCVLQPDSIQGPYYVSGEYIREDIRECQDGIDLYVDIQVVDVTTCKTLHNVYLDFWHANATGVYSGVLNSDNGNGDDLSNVNNTFFRGLQPTDREGVVSFTTKFPGHYTGRTAHVHIMSHTSGVVFKNGTFAGNSSSHIGQFYFDQSLINQVEATSVYSTNKQELTQNKDDFLLVAATDTGLDPVFQYVYLGKSIEDGIFAWISVGINSTESNAISPAAWLTDHGGVINENYDSGIGAQVTSST